MNADLSRNHPEEFQRLKKMLEYEHQAYHDGYQRIAGIDEVGRGPIAGPVVAAAVILPRDFCLAGVNDSKLLSEKKRLELAKIIKLEALAWSVAAISSRRIDEINILQATLEAMCLAVHELMPQPDYLLVDAVKIPGLSICQCPIIKGDTLSVSIACASILAKVERDQIMQNYDGIYAGYGFATHKGYGTRGHHSALHHLGPCPIHRGSFAPVRSMLSNEGCAEPSLFD
ncbi:MAG: ribonuclease HII [Syntrophomonadaceae bacterium]